MESRNDNSSTYSPASPLRHYDYESSLLKSTYHELQSRKRKLFLMVDDFKSKKPSEVRTGSERETTAHNNSTEEEGEEGEGAEAAAEEEAAEVEVEAAEEEEAEIEAAEEEEAEVGAVSESEYENSQKHHESSNWRAGTAGFLKPTANESADPYWRGNAQPLIRAAWAGDFSVYCSRDKICATFEGLKACISSKVGARARALVEQLPPKIRWEKLPRCSLWPESFEPTDDDMAVFFFPSLTKHETLYDSLVVHLIRDDMALRTSLSSGLELLLFTSVELPPLFTRFQGNIYLWGVFKGYPPL